MCHESRLGNNCYANLMFAPVIFFSFYLYFLSTSDLRGRRSYKGAVLADRRQITFIRTSSTKIHDSSSHSQNDPESDTTFTQRATAHKRSPIVKSPSRVNISVGYIGVSDGENCIQIGPPVVENGDLV